MRSTPSTDQGWYRFLSRWYATWVIGVLWLLFSAPVVTVFAATAAASAAAHRLRQEDRAPSVADFARYCHRYFRPATGSGCVLLGIGCLIAADLYVGSHAHGPVAVVAICGTGPLAVCLVTVVAIHHAALVTSGSSTAMRALKTSYLTASRRPLTAVTAAAVAFAAVFVALNAPLVLQPVVGMTGLGAAFVGIDMVTERALAATRSTTPTRK
ncbi:MAG TPA: DUF624 domain-containing protein [Streptosporangiales bacterium]